MTTTTPIDPATVAERIQRSVGRTGQPQRLTDLVSHQIRTADPTISFLDSFSVAEELLPAVRFELQTLMDRSREEGRFGEVELSGTEQEYVRGVSSEDPGLGPDERCARARRAFAPAILGALRDLDWRGFEVLSAKVLGLLGCTSPFVSTPSNDGGIDFYGQLHLQGRLNQSLPLGGIDNRLKIWLIGQAKHYPDRPIAPSFVRELVGSVELARTGGATQEWKGLEIAPFDAVVQMFFSTGEFSPGSRGLLAKSGLISMDGNQLATFLADAGIGFGDGDDSFDIAKLQADLDSTPP